jgi:hypothetical protein
MDRKSLFEILAAGALLPGAVLFLSPPVGSIDAS